MKHYLIAQHRGIDAIGFNALDVPPSAAAMRVMLREYAARCKAVLDVRVFNTQPKFFGPPVLLADVAMRPDWLTIPASKPIIVSSFSISTR